MKFFKGIFIPVFIMIFAFSGCASSGGFVSGGAGSAADVFKNGSFFNGAKLGANENPVSLSDQMIKIEAIVVDGEDDSSGTGFLYKALIDFDRVIDCSEYNALVLDWNGIYAGNFGGVAMTAYVITSDGKKTGSIGEWTQQQALGKVVFNFVGASSVGQVNDGVMKDDEIPWRESGKTCVGIELSCDFGMRAGGEDENWDWFPLSFDQLEPWFLEEIKFF